MGNELKQIADSIGELKTHIEKRAAEVDALKRRLDSLERKVSAGSFEGPDREEKAAIEKRLNELEATSKRLPYRVGGDEPESLGKSFVESAAYGSFDALGGHVGDAFAVPSFFGTKAGELTGESLGNVAGYLYQPQRVPGIIGPPELQPRVRDLFPINPTSEGAVEFVRETGFTNAAAPTAETIEKPQSAIDLEIRTQSVRTIAHWLPATRQIISDSASLRAYIDTRLVYGLALTEDDELLNGDGSAAHLTGLLTDEDVQTITQGDAAAADNMADTIRRAITLVEIAGYPANGVLLHPSDWESIELLKDEDGRYLFAQPQQRAARQMWGLPVVTSLAMSLGQFSCGAYNLAAAIWDREQSQVRLSDQHDDFFTRNLVAILAEERLALTVYRPEAVVLGTFTGSGS
ncbi:MAG TPA: phage major capsid protein [Armatimonadota bacterium]|nr:phage major capsid protein [Armatimonadota bacterium]